MDFSQSFEDLRREVRGFLEEELGKGDFETLPEAWLKGFSRDFSKKLARRGYIGFTVPEEYGGRGRSYKERLVLAEELLKYGAPVAAHWMTDRQICASILTNGSEEQKNFFLPRIVKGEVFFCIAMSEPDAGSDLASLKTWAREEGNYFIINGKKIWVCWAHLADYMYLLARTGEYDKKHKGLSEFLINMRTRGIKTRLIRDMTDIPHFNEVFLDDVRVPRNCLLGEKDRGWYQATPQLDYERSGIERIMGCYPLIKAIRDFITDGYGRIRFSEMLIEFEVGKTLLRRIAWLMDEGKLTSKDTAVAKVFATEFCQRFSNFALNSLSGTLKRGIPEKWVSLEYLISPGFTIQGGTSEILRNIIARTLGLGG